MTAEGLLEAFFQQPYAKVMTHEKFAEMAAVGQTLFLLDGIDEIANVEEARRALRGAFHTLVDRYPRCRWVLTSRVVGYDEVPFDVREDERLNRGRSGFCEVQVIAPFDSRRIEQFARKWYALREKAEDVAQKGADDLVKAVHAHPHTLRLARIPNTLTLMALIHRVEAHLPHGKAKLYDKIAEAYLETLDRIKRIRDTVYTLVQKKRWLAYVGFQMQQRRERLGERQGELLVSRPDVIKWIMETMMARRGRRELRTGRRRISRLSRTPEWAPLAER